MGIRLFLFCCATLSSLASAQCLDSTVDLPSSKWRNGEHMPKYSMMKRHSGKPNKITIHYTGVKKNGAQTITKKLRGLVGYSQTGLGGTKTELWGDMPYNYYIDMNGTSAEGRDAGYRPDTNTEYNPDRHVTIVVEGTTGDDLSAAQKAKLFAMIKGLQNKYNIPTSAVGIHKHYASTSCPGPEIEAAIKEYKRNEAGFVPNPNACAPAVVQKPQPPSKVKPVMRPASGGSFDDDETAR